MESNFVDYFMIGGLDSASEDIEEWCRDGSKSEFKSPLDRSYVPSVLAYYPKERRGRLFAEEVLLLCLPKGVRFRTQKTVPREPSFHTFVCVRSDGSRIYGGVLTFYELVVDDKIVRRMQTLHNDYLRELTATKNRSCAESTEDTKRSYRRDDGGSSFGSHTLPRRGRLRQQRSLSFYDSNSDELYMSKCLVLITGLPIVSACESLLRALLDVSSGRSEVSLPLESYVYWILHELPLPPPGRSLKASLVDRDIVFQYPGADELPFFDYPIAEVLTRISIDSFLKVYTCILLERQVLFCSKDLQRLMLFAETFQILLFPFRWQHVYVPILPFTQVLFLEAPVPFIMGLCYDDSIPEKVFELNICVVDIDMDHVELPEEVPLLPDRAELVSQLTESLVHSSEYTGWNLTFHQEDGKSNVIADHRFSRSFDDDSINVKSVDKSATNVQPLDLRGGGSTSRRLLLPLNVLHESESLARVTAIAKKAGVDINIELLQKELEDNSAYQQSTHCRCYFKHMRLNSFIREVFLNRFLTVLFSYDHFIIGCADPASFVTSRDSMQNFDKVSFLSDQPQSQVPFLAAFLETQMFTSFIDSKIISAWEPPDPNLRLFDGRLSRLRSQHGDSIVRTPTCDSVVHAVPSVNEITERELHMDYQVPPPHPLGAEDSIVAKERPIRCGPFHFPLLDGVLLEDQSKDRTKGSPWKQRYKYFGADSASVQTAKEAHAASAGYQAAVDPTILTASQVSSFTHKKSKIVEKLVREAQAKTKRLLVEKLGREAVSLGHSKLSIGGVEENTLVASLCDVIERIWSHGSRRKRGKSALWAFLLEHYEKTSKKTSCGPLRAQGLASVSFGSAPRRLGRWQLPSDSASWSHLPFLYKADRMRSSSAEPLPRDHCGIKSHEAHQHSSLPSLPTSIDYDLSHVMRMVDIKTEIGYARAFIRLALERKLLYKHLKTLLECESQLESMYDPYAFLMHDEEKEQFLYHVLSLNAAEFYCFTSTFNQTKITYEVQLVFSGGSRFIFPLGQLSICFVLTGSLNRTELIRVTKNAASFTFEHKNLGVLSTLRIGQDLSNASSASVKWYLEHAIVRDQVTGRTYKFSCSRWFGREMDDGSLERLLIAEPLPLTNSNGIKSPQRSHSPCSPRRQRCDNPRKLIQLVQQQIGDAVNRIVKHFYPCDSEHASLTHLLCGEKGLVSCLNDAFLVGLRSPRDNASQFSLRYAYPWDFIETFAYCTVERGKRKPIDRKKYEGWLDSISKNEKTQGIDDMPFIMNYCKQVVDSVNRNPTVGKDGKFKTFVLLALRSHLLSSIVSTMACSPVAAKMYDEISFLRIHDCALFLTDLLLSLDDFNFDLDEALIGDLKCY
uniref:UDENN domain-containing protein n=1 Tax=Trichuris muris TaxID=70415 RepID=A0A5S6Q9G9_TRIMR